jgi:hypothetical protein
MGMADRLRMSGLWLHEVSGQWPVISWVLHGLAAFPLIGLAAWQPWLAPALVFAYREGEQVWHRFLNYRPYAWLDHIIDVAVPGALGWWLLR